MKGAGSGYIEIRSVGRELAGLFYGFFQRKLFYGSLS